MNKKTISDLIDALVIVRENITAEYEHLSAGQKKAEQEAKTKFSAQYYPEELKKIEAEYAAKREAIREKCRDLYNPIIEELEARAIGNAMAMNKSLMDEVRAFESIPLTAAEYGAILEHYGNRNYYVDRFLEKLAETNGLIIGNVQTSGLRGLEPSLDRKLAILKDLKERADRFVNDYGTFSGDNFETRQALFPAFLTTAEDSYTNGLYADALTPRQIAGRVAEAMRTNPGNASRVLDNAIANATPSVRSAIYNEMVTAEDGILQNAVQRSQSREKIAAFDVGGYEMAEKAFLSLGKEGIDAQEVFRTNSGNVFFNDMAKEFKQGEAVTWETVPTESAAAEASV